MSIKNAAMLIAIAMLALAPSNVSAAEDPDGEAGWGKGAYFKSADGRFSLNLGSRVQVRYTQDDPDGGDGHGDDAYGAYADDYDEYHGDRYR